VSFKESVIFIELIKTLKLLLSIKSTKPSLFLKAPERILTESPVLISSATE